MNARKLFPVSGLLRNSTIFAAQKWGFVQCPQKAPENREKLKQRAYCSQTVIQTLQAYHREYNLEGQIDVRAKSWPWAGVGVH